MHSVKQRLIAAGVGMAMNVVLAIRTSIFALTSVTAIVALTAGKFLYCR